MSTSVIKACFIQLVKKRWVVILFLKKVLVELVEKFLFDVFFRY